MFHKDNSPCRKIHDLIYANNIHSSFYKSFQSNFNKPLLTPKTEEEDLLSKQQEDCLIARMRMFVHLRQDLERVCISITIMTIFRVPTQVLKVIKRY